MLRGNLAPDGAVIKPSAATPALMRHRGRAVVFESIEDYKARIDDESLDIDETCVMVLKNCGPKGYPGMAEVGNMGLPPKLLRKGITDMVRISDARMSRHGLRHRRPARRAGGGRRRPARAGARRRHDRARRRGRAGCTSTCPRRSSPRRRAALGGRRTRPWRRGYQRLYVDHVLQADQGADLDFLRGTRGAAVPRHSH